MATIKELDDRLRLIEQTISKARGAVAVLSFLVLGVGALAGWALKEIHDLDVRSAALQTLVTNKLPEIALLRLGTHPAEAAKTYVTTKNLLVEASRSKEGLKAETTESVSKILVAQAPQQSSTPQFWQLASYVIDQRSLAPTNLPIDCLAPGYAKDDRLLTVDPKTGITKDSGVLIPNPTWPSFYTFHLRDCNLRLDSPNFWKTGVGQKIQYEAGKTSKGVSLALELDHVSVTYEGGQLIPVSSIIFTNCSFKFNVQTAPAKDGRSLGVELLRANLSEPVRLENLSGM